MKTPEERVRIHRLRAEEMRTAAEGMRRPDSRASSLRIARDSDLMRTLWKPKSIQNSDASRGRQQFQQHRRSARRWVSTYRLGIR